MKNTSPTHRYLVTGVAGFIASHVAQVLLEKGHVVIGIDNLNDAYDPRLKRYRLKGLKNPNFTFIHADVSDHESLATIFRKFSFDAVFNLAARAGVRQSTKDPWSYYGTNVTGTLNLLDLCKEYNVPKFVLASTSSLYGQSELQPFNETMSTDRPLSPYAASKKAAESLAYTYHYLYDIDVSVLRYFTVYGPAGRPDMSIFRFIRWIDEGETLEIYGDGTQRRDFTYVSDIARGTVAAVRTVGYEIINLGGHRPHSINQVIEMIESYLGKEARRTMLPAHPADVRATWADVSKAARILGWKPQISLEQGLKMAVDWYRENKSWARQIVLD